MSELKNLQNQLMAKHDCTVIEVKERSFPVVELTLNYYPIQKSPMDILMKMMLISFNRAPIKATDVLANILLVEPLFIEDLTKKMIDAGLIERPVDQPYLLTEKGKQQLEAGIFEERMPLATETVYYSDIHETLLYGDIDAVLERDELPEPLDYVNDHIETIHELNVLNELEQMYVNEVAQEEEDAVPQLFVQAIEQYEFGTLIDIPVALFLLQDNASGRKFARVFNYYVNDWDDILEQFVTTNEKTTWNA